MDGGTDMQKKKKKCVSYHLSVLGVFVCVRRTSNVIPHLTGRHCKNYTLSHRKRKKRGGGQGQRGEIVN